LAIQALYGKSKSHPQFLYPSDPGISPSILLWQSPTRKATGGTIDKNGVFTAEKDEGNFVITATIGGITGSVNLTIAKEGAIPPKPSKPPVEGINKLFWNGEVPPQKWMNFYTKVLSKFAGGKGLKITINVEVSPEGGVSKQKIEETKVALRELGLNDDLKSE
jgi:hypothetical protein